MVSFFPVRDIPLRFISLNRIFSAPIGRIYPIFVQTLRRVHDISYSRFAAAENFFGESLAKEKSIFGFFLKRKGYIFECCLCSKLGDPNIFALVDGKPFRRVTCCYIFAEFFSTSFCQEKRKVLNFSETDLTFLIAHCVSQVRRSFCTNALVGSVCLLLSCIGKIVIDRGRNFWWPTVFHREFLAKTNENPSFFQRAIVFLHFSGLISHVWHANNCWVMECEVFVAFSLQVIIF